MDDGDLRRRDAAAVDAHAVAGRGHDGSAAPVANRCRGPGLATAAGSAAACADRLRAGRPLRIVRRRLGPQVRGQPADPDASVQVDRRVRDSRLPADRVVQPVPLRHPVPVQPAAAHALLRRRGDPGRPGGTDAAAAHRGLGSRGRQGAAGPRVAPVRTRVRSPAAGHRAAGRTLILPAVSAPGQPVVGYSREHPRFQDRALRLDVAGQRAAAVHGRQSRLPGGFRRRGAARRRSLLARPGLLAFRWPDLAGRVLRQERRRANPSRRLDGPMVLLSTTRTQ